MKFADLWGKRLVFFDGAMGTMLQQAGLKGGELPELWNWEKPEVVEGIHRRYREAGCDILKTNTFGANRFKLAGSGHTVEAVVCRAVELARRAAGENGLVALDIGTDRQAPAAARRSGIRGGVSGVPGDGTGGRKGGCRLHPDRDLQRYLRGQGGGAGGKGKHHFAGDRHNDFRRARQAADRRGYSGGLRRCWRGLAWMRSASTAAPDRSR